MKSFFKKYWTHIISFLIFMILLLTLFSGIENYNLFTILLLILMFAGVIGCWIAIIYYIIYVAKSDQIENKGLKIVLIYLFNLYYIPCFKLKYVDKDDNYKIKNTIFIILMLIFTFVYLWKTFNLVSYN